MRLPLLILLTVTAAGCRCSPATPSAVTLRVKNGTHDPIFVDDRNGRLGLEVQQQQGVEWLSFEDQPCPCLLCENACDGTCQCADAGQALGAIAQIDGDGTAERTWAGQVMVQGFRSCADSCLDPQNAPLDETFNVHLCYATLVPGFVPLDGGVGPGAFPNDGVDCVDKTFRPSDGVVEVGPQRGADCTTTADCKGVGENCFGGACTSGCPANGVPLLGSNWGLNIAVTNMGFFTVTALTGVNQYDGVGTIASASYNGPTLKLTLTRPDPGGGTVTGGVDVTFPQGTGAPLTAGTKVAVKLLSRTGSTPDRAVVLRDPSTQTLLFAADMRFGAALLSADDVLPAAVTVQTVPMGCRSDGTCGKALFFPVRFSVGSDGITLDPGKDAVLSTAQGRWHFLNVYDGAYATTTCDVSEIRPWALWAEP